MMAAFNVSSLSDFGYPETTKFIDPMEERWRSRNYDASKFTEQGVQDRLYEFYMLDAYDKVDDVEKALESYYANGPPKTTLATSTIKASTTTPSLSTKASASTITSSAKIDDKKTTSTKKDDKKTTTTKK